ncbi:hypothetical protein [Methylobacterium sp. WSM2598]|uniref:hypothetical protein n=1 Tax=Methylobacterium sp. WSM2598 TaxID=398261 RepID=UPI000399AEAE|nr:hypothetical protein [Methylobacterium sp. WSM2598]
MTDRIADGVFVVFASGLGVLVAANIALLVARLTHRDRLARRITSLASRVTWLFKVGRDSEDDCRNDRLRA